MADDGDVEAAGSFSQVGEQVGDGGHLQHPQDCGYGEQGETCIRFVYTVMDEMDDSEESAFDGCAGARA